MAEDALIRVLLVDDHGIVRRGISAYLAQMDDIEVVGEAGNGRQALDLVARLEAAGAAPDVILMDLLMPEMDGIATTEAIKERWPEIDVVALTSFIEEAKVHGALRAGATGYLLKDAQADEIARAIRAAFNGQMHLDPAVARTLAESVRSDRPVEPLTPREREILALVAEGRANKEIARLLAISERTARTHVSNILGKLGLTSRTQAALYAIEQGLVPSREQQS
jgi:DNA-binding NarL/FixJ family response regulator